MSIEEAREILGTEAMKYSDDELEKLITDLEILAKDTLRMAREKLQEERRIISWAKFTYLRLTLTNA